MKVEVDVLGSPSLIVLMVSVDPSNTELELEQPNEAPRWKQRNNSRLRLVVVVNAPSAKRQQQQTKTTTQS